MKRRRSKRIAQSDPRDYYEALSVTEPVSRQPVLIEEDQGLSAALIVGIAVVALLVILFIIAKGLST